MPSKRRRDVIDDSVVGAYHVYDRCTRQDFLLGLDPVRDRDFSYRKEMFLKRLEMLQSVFAVECLDDAVLDNHFHMILRNRPDLVLEWSDQEVAERWLRLNRRELDLRSPPTSDQVAGLVADTKRLKKIRQRLASVSWLMGYLREPLARAFNAEDGIRGFFWGRFGCEPLKNETSLLACSLYVAMNPVRAGIATSVETSRHTSVEARLVDRQSGDPARPKSGWLAAVHVDGDGFEGATDRRRPSDKGYLGLTFDEYLDLLDQMIQRERAEKRGKYDHAAPSILERLGISPAAWEATVRLTSRRFTRELDEMAKIRAAASERTSGR